MIDRLKVGRPSEAFDQSREAQKRRFEEQLADPAWVDEAAGWYSQNVALARSLRMDWSDIGGHIVGDDFHFPGNLSRVVTELDLGPDLGGQVTEIINKHPHLVLATPHVVSPKTREALARINPELEEILTKNFGPGKSEEQRDIEFEEAHGEELRNFAITLGLSRLSIDKIAEVASLLWRSRELLLGALYHYHVLSEATKILKDRMPSLAEDLERVRQNCLLAQSGLSDIDGQTQFAYIGVGPFYGIRVQKDIYTDDFDISHGYRILAVAHELTHALVAGQIFQIKPYKPGIYKRAREEKLLPEEKRRLEREKPASFERVVLEAVGIWAEEEIAEKMRHRSGHTPTLDRMNRFMEGRRRKIMAARVLLEERTRLRAGMDSDVASAGPLAYYEGVNLVDRWKEIGISFSEIGAKLKAFVIEARAIVGNDMTELSAIPLDYAEDSKYQQLMALLIR